MQAIAKPVTPILQRGHPLARGIVLAIPLTDEAGSGTPGVFGTGSTGYGVAKDYSGYNNDGTFFNGPVWQSGPFGSSVEFGITFSTQYITLPATASLTLTGALTLACWVRTTGTNQPVLIGGYQSGSPFAGYALDLGGGGTTGVPSFWNGTNWNNGPGGLPVNDGLWHSVVITHDGVGAAKFYSDGVYRGSTGCGPPNPRPQDQRSIGSDIQNFGQLAGNMDAVSIYTRELSAAEVAQLHFDPFVIYRNPSRWWETATAAAPPAYVPYNPWPQQAPVLAQ